MTPVPFVYLAGAAVLAFAGHALTATIIAAVILSSRCWNDWRATGRSNASL